VIQAEPQRRSLEGLPNGGLGVRSTRERLEDVRDLCLEQGKNLRIILRLAWGKAHPGEPLPVEWQLASSIGQIWVPDEKTLYHAELRLIHGKWREFSVVRGEVRRSDGHVWETHLDRRGNCRYFRDRQLHRDDGPAVIWDDGSVEYWVNGQLHRLDGPAVIWDDETVQFWVENRRLTAAEFLARYGQREQPF